MADFTKKDAAELKRLNRKLFGGKGTRKEVLRALDLRRQKLAAADQAGADDPLAALISAVDMLVENGLCESGHGSVIEDNARAAITEARGWRNRIQELEAINVDFLGAMVEARAEISRLNNAAGFTVFNPAATDLIDASINTGE